jgi:hypothetical protein
MPVSLESCDRSMPVDHTHISKAEAQKQTNERPTDSYWQFSLSLRSVLQAKLCRVCEIRIYIHGGVARYFLLKVVPVRTKNGNITLLSLVLRRNKCVMALISVSAVETSDTGGFLWRSVMCSDNSKQEDMQSSSKGVRRSYLSSATVMSHCFFQLTTLCFTSVIQTFLFVRIALDVISLQLWNPNIIGVHVHLG